MQCYWCKVEHEKLTRDHLIPQSLGGIEYVFACESCNQKRGKLAWFYDLQQQLESKRHLRTNIKLFLGNLKYYLKNLTKMQQFREELIKWELESSGFCPSRVMVLKRPLWLSKRRIRYLRKIK